MPENLQGLFCAKGCKHAYQHERECVKPKNYAMAPLPDTYPLMEDRVLIETYDSLHADYNRYSTQTGGEYHRPTWVEAGRRMDLARCEMLNRMSKGRAKEGT